MQPAITQGVMWSLTATAGHQGDVRSGACAVRQRHTKIKLKTKLTCALADKISESLYVIDKSASFNADIRAGAACNTPSLTLSLGGLGWSHTLPPSPVECSPLPRSLTTSYHYTTALYWLVAPDTSRASKLIAFKHHHPSRVNLSLSRTARLSLVPSSWYHWSSTLSTAAIGWISTI